MGQPSNSQVCLGTKGLVSVQASLPLRIPAGATGTHTLNAANWLAVSLVIEVSSHMQDQGLQYQAAPSDAWITRLMLNPARSGIVPNDVDVAEVEHVQEACTAGKAHKIAVDASFRQTPVGPKNPITREVLSASC